MAAEKMGKRLKRLRVLASLTQSEVAAHAGFDRALLSLVEAGYRDLSEQDAARVESYLQGRIEKKARELQTAISAFSEAQDAAVTHASALPGLHNYTLA